MTISLQVGPILFLRLIWTSGPVAYFQSLPDELETRFFFALLVLACTPGNEEVTVEMILEHENTLRLEKVDDWLVKVTENGFSVSTKDSQTFRVPEQVNVRLLAPSGNSQGEWPHRKIVNGHDIVYRVDKNAGGSAGPGYQLSAKYASDKGTVFLTQYTQSESKPDFSLTWMVIEKLH